MAIGYGIGSWCDALAKEKKTHEKGAAYLRRLPRKKKSGRVLIAIFGTCRLVLATQLLHPSSSCLLRKGSVVVWYTYPDEGLELSSFGVIELQRVGKSRGVRGR